MIKYIVPVPTAPLPGYAQAVSYTKKRPLVWQQSLPATHLV